jgi:hypothetical protein
MTVKQHNEQRARVRESLELETHRDVYPARDPKADIRGASICHAKERPSARRVMR